MRKPRAQKGWSHVKIGLYHHFFQGQIGSGLRKISLIFSFFFLGGGIHFKETNLDKSSASQRKQLKTHSSSHAYCLGHEKTLPEKMLLGHRTRVNLRFFQEDVFFVEIRHIQTHWILTIH